MPSKIRTELNLYTAVVDALFRSGLPLPPAEDLATVYKISR